MATFLLITILVSIAALAVLVIYLIDRINTLQRLTRLLQPDPGPIVADPQKDGPFGDLSGQRLWDALNGAPTEGWDPTAIELIRNRYSLVLRKHIEDLFLEGVIDGRSGRQQIPSSTRQVRTLRGTVESWIPVESAMTIYKAGWDKSTAPAEALPTVRISLDQAAEGLYNMVAIKLPRPMSEHLMPTEPQEIPALEAPGMAASGPGEGGAPIALGMSGTTAPSAEATGEAAVSPNPTIALPSAKTEPAVPPKTALGA